MPLLPASITVWACLEGWQGTGASCSPRPRLQPVLWSVLQQQGGNGSARLRHRSWPSQTTPGGTRKDELLPPTAPCLGTSNPLQLPEPCSVSREGLGHQQLQQQKPRANRSPVPLPAFIYPGLPQMPNKQMPNKPNWSQGPSEKSTETLRCDLL